MLEIIGLQERQREPVARFSGGMKRRVNIGIALMHRPQLLILDEPTVGIDPQSRRHILDSVKELNQAGATVLYTTHYMEEAQELSHHIAIMDQGSVIAEGTHDELVRTVGEFDRVELAVSGNAAQAALRWQDIPGVRAITPADCAGPALQGDGTARQRGQPPRRGERLTPGNLPWSSKTATWCCPGCSSLSPAPAHASPP